MRDKPMARRAAAAPWVVAPPLLLSGLIHTIDANVGDLHSLASPSMLLSVVAYGSPIVAMALVCLGLAARGRSVAPLSVAFVFAALVAVTLALLQTPRPPYVAGLARPIIGGTILVWAVLAVAALPARALGWPATGGEGQQ